MKRIIGLYARCSTEKQDLITQKSQLLNHVERYKEDNDVSVVKEYFDEGYSGSNKNRPQLQKLLKDVEAGEVNTVIIAKLDRLARSLQDLKDLTKKLEDNNCDLVVIKDKIDTSTAAGRLFFNMYASFIEFEREVIIQRMKDGIEHARTHGSKSGKPCHRPRKDIDMEKLRLLHRNGSSVYMIAKVLGVSRVLIKKRLNEIM